MQIQIPSEFGEGDVGFMLRILDEMLHPRSGTVSNYLHEKLRDSAVVEASVLADGRLLVGKRERPCSQCRYDERLSVSRSLP